MIEATSCGGIVIFHGKILLLYKNFRNRYEGWVLPKGTVEQGETHEQTALREVREETGVSARIVEYIGASEYTFSAQADVVEKSVHWYLMSSDSYYSKPQKEEYFMDSGYYKYHEAYHLLKFSNEKIMLEKGDALIPLYQKELPVLREQLKNTDPALWSSSLYTGWLHTLTPLLSPRPEGYPAFARSEEWLKKTLETYEGSYTELKHDTVLYAKQVYVAEGDGEAPKDRDDRGYVEPEPEVYARFASLAQDTKDGLDRLGMLDAANREMLDGLSSLAGQLLAISEKELQNQTLTNEEYDLIRNYGSMIERYWEAYKEDTYKSGLGRSMQLDASLVTDIASGDGWILQIGTGLAQKVIVLVPVDGSLRFASGTVYSFYEFLNGGQRLTDSEWKDVNGFRPGPNSGPANPVDKPGWTMTYRINPYNR